MAKAIGLPPTAEPEINAPLPGPGGPSLTTLATMVVAVLALYFGRDILVPLALAALLSFMLGPIVMRFRRWGLGRVPSVLIVVTFAFIAIGGFGALVGSQLVQLAANAPTYEMNLRAKIQALQLASPGGGVLDRASTMVRELGTQLSRQNESESAVETTAERPAAPAPVPVQIHEPPPSPLQVIRDVAGPLLGPIGTAGLVIVFVIFILIEREDLRDRLIRLVGGGELNVTTEALDDASRRVSRYLLMQLVVNTTYGLPIGLGLYFIGVPNALLWGVLATVLRFVPYVGPFIAALFPVALAIAVDPGWSMLLWTVALFLGMELFSNNVVEPWLYGSSTGISAIAIILAAILWTTLWGPVGLFLSTPLTVCLAVMGRYIPQLQFLSVMLGSEPVFTPAERLYQRMLAGDPDEGGEIAEEFLEDRPLASFYDDVALPALRLAERDRQRKVLVGKRRAVLTESFMRVVTELEDHEDPEPETNGAEGRTNQGRPHAEVPADRRVQWAGNGVLCIAGRTGMDRVAATMLAQLLERHGIGAQVLPADALTPDGMSSLDLRGIEVVCLSYLSLSAVARARQVARRLRRRAPEVKIMVGLWNAQVDEEKEGDQTAGLSADFIATSLQQAVERIEHLATAEIVTPMEAAPTPADEEERLADLKSLNILDTGPEESFDRVTRRLAEAFKAPISLLSLVDEYRQFWKSAAGLPEDLAVARQAPRDTSICSHVVAGNELLVIEDTLKDKRFANNPFLRERGIRFYAGAPLRSAAGRAIGSLCVIDTKPRTVSEHERALLQMVADEVMAEIEKRSGAASRTDRGHAA